MECHADKNLSPEEHEKRTLSRRELLKALLASGGVAATSMLLPCEWTSPDVEVGVLPAHAQVSPTATPQADGDAGHGRHRGMLRDERRRRQAASPLPPRCAPTLM